MRFIYLVAFAISFFALGETAQAASPTAYLEDAAILATGKTISISRLPTTGSNGKVEYFDVDITLSVDANGKPSLKGAPVVKASPDITPTNFIAGRYYIRVGNTNYLGSLTSAVGAGGSTIWNLTMDQGSVGSYPQQATWQTGTPSPDVASRISTAKIKKNPNYSYGTSPAAGYYTFVTNGLLAAEQVNNTLTLVSYSHSGDQQLPYGSVILGLCANASCSNAPK
jgi:hypothetical protein